LGGYTVNAKQDGLTDMSSIKVNYLAIGSIQPSAGNFGGNVTAPGSARSVWKRPTASPRSPLP
jgi:hypothetical protein